MQSTALRTVKIDLQRTYAEGLKSRQETCEKVLPPIGNDSVGRATARFRRDFISESAGRERHPGIAAIRDMIVSQAVIQVLKPIFEAMFSSTNHGFKPR